jgi:hypothetical protein
VSVAALSLVGNPVEPVQVLFAPVGRIARVPLCLCRALWRIHAAVLADVLL